MRTLSLLVVAALLAAGCVGTSEDAESAAPETTTPADTTPGTSGEAPVPGDGDLGDMPHLHDYWSGKERITLFDGELDASTHAFEGTLLAAAFDREARAGGLWWLLPEGSIVYEGTGQMEITATWSDPAITSLGVAYKPADSTEMGPLMPLVSGQPLVIDVSAAMTDMPHSSTSRWQFYFGPVDSPGASMGVFDLLIDVVKMRDIDLFPGHPDLFEGETSKTLFQGSHRTEKPSYATRGPYLLENGDFGEPEFAPTRVVPMETQLIRVEVTVTGAEATAGEVTQVRFFYRGADSNNLQPGGSGSLLESNRFVWDVPVTMEMTDSPYATASQWRFMVEPATSFSELDPTCGGCVDSALEFDAVITAFAVAPE